MQYQEYLFNTSYHKIPFYIIQYRDLSSPPAQVQINIRPNFIPSFVVGVKRLSLLLSYRHRIQKNQCKNKKHRSKNRKKYSKRICNSEIKGLKKWQKYFDKDERNIMIIQGDLPCIKLQGQPINHTGLVRFIKLPSTNTCTE